jgi:prefoldin subunit 5
MSTQFNGDLLRLLEIKRELLVKLLEAMKRAAALLQDDDMDAFDQEMESCTQLMKTIDETGATVDRLKAQISDMRRYPEIAGLENNLVYIADQIELARRDCNTIAELKLKIYGQQIKAIRGARRGIEGYASQLQKRDAVFIDAKK